jgi:PAS domain S-box-containing protein
MLRPTEPSSVLPAARAARTTVLLSFALFAVFALLLLGERSFMIRESGEAVRLAQRAHQLSAEITVRDASMSQAVQMATTTGDQGWARIFEDHAPLMVAAIDEAFLMLSPEAAGRFDHTVRVANDGLIALRREALQHVLKRQPEAGRDLLLIASYTEHKEQLDQGMQAFLQALHADLASQAASSRQATQRSVAVLLLASALALALFWQVLQRYLGRAQREHEAQESLRHGLARQDQVKAWMLEGSGLGTWTWDLKSDALELNPLARETLQIAPAEYEGMTLTRWVARVHPDDAPAISAAFTRHIKGDTRLVEGEYRLADGDGHWIWVGLRGGVAERDAQGRALTLAGTALDVTERRRVLQQREDSLRLIDAVLEAIPLPVVMKTPDGRYLRHNRAFAVMSGQAGDVQPGQPPALIDEAAAEIHRSVDRQLLSEPGEHRYELRQRFGDGREMDVLVHKATVCSRDGSVLGIVATTIDITDQKTHARALTDARDAANAANRAKSAFLAAMSHELRTPMNGVLGMAELLALSRLDTEQKQTVHTIRESAHALLRILDDILDFSKIEAGRLSLEDEAVPLGQLVDSVCESLAPVAATQGVRITASIAPELPLAVRGDELRLRQILLNLMGNAIKFSGGRSGVPGDVRLRLETAGEQLQARISDNGIGIAPDTLQRLFAPFVQAETQTTRRFGGTGLGLAISRRLAHLMQGSIGAQSTLGAGAEFVLSLPLRPAADAASALRMPPSAAVDLQDLSVDIVEHPTLDADLIAAWLQAAGARVHRHASLDAATEAVIRSAGAHQPVLIVDESALATSSSHTAVLAGLPCLVVGRGRRLPPRMTSHRSARLDLVLQAPLLRGVALLAGIGVPELAAPASDELGLGPAIDLGPQTSPRSVEEARQRGQLILVAEDDAVNRIVIARQLALLGHAAEVVNDGEEALQRWRSGRHALLLSDLHMPERDGYALAQAVRDDEAQHGGQRRPVIALTANALKGEAARARAAGFDDYLTKPLPLKRLKAALKRWMPAPRRLAEPTRRVLDVGVLRTLVGDDETAVQDLLREFLDSGATQLAALQQAVRARRGDEARALAHSLKSACRSIGAAPLADCCAELERNPGAESLLASLAELTQHSLIAVQAALDGSDLPPATTLAPSPTHPAEAIAA